ncbi:MAG: trimethylamine methyltransferase family protein [Anaerolineae bacterium]|nr:trimethylamine methyltransferase family protein [Anaerolineae bacterium]
MGHGRLQLQVLSEEAVDQIQETAYRLLEDVGIALEHARAREMLHGLGCKIDRGRTLIPRELIAWALDQLTPLREYRTRDGAPGFTLGDGQIRFHSGGGQPIALDLDSGRQRPATLQDIADSSRLFDALPEVDQVVPLFTPQDVPGELLYIESLAAMLYNTRKPVSCLARNPEEVPYLVELAAACCGGVQAFRQQPNLLLTVSPISPLRFTEEITATILAVAETGASFKPTQAPTLGGTGPVSIAGALAQEHAEVLASFLLAAAARPGVPALYCSRIFPLDPRTALTSDGPETGMASAGAAQLAHRLGFSCDAYGLRGTYGRLTNALIPALAGVDLLSGVGIGDGLTAGCEIAVLDADLVSLLKHIVAGYEVSEATLAYDVIKEVVGRDGIFLGERHTVRQMRAGAVWLPRLSSATAGPMAANLLAGARARAREILSTHQVEPLPEEVCRSIDEILIRARSELGPQRIVPNG